MIKIKYSVIKILKKAKVFQKYIQKITKIYKVKLENIIILPSKRIEVVLGTRSRNFSPFDSFVLLILYQKAKDSICIYTQVLWYQKLQ